MRFKRIHARITWIEHDAIVTGVFYFHSVIGKRSFKLGTEGVVPYKHRPMYFLNIDAAGRAVHIETMRWKKHRPQRRRLVRVELLPIEVDRTGTILRPL